MDVRRRAKILARTACAAGAVLVIAGCNGSDPIVTETPMPSTSGSAEPQPSVTPSVSVSPSVAALSDAELLEILPAGAEFPDVEGAVVTAQFFLGEYAPMFRSGNTELWDSLSTESCNYCQGASANAREASDYGWVASGGGIEVQEGETRGNLGSDGFSYVTLVADVAESVLISKDGVTDKRVEGGPATFVMQLVLEGDVWRVNGVNVESREAT